MAERRRAERRAISHYLQVMDASTHEILGSLVNVSSKGIMIDGRNPMQISKTIRVRMDTTSDIANTLNIEFTARVKWCQEDTFSPGIYDIGLEFVHISVNSAEVLARVAEKYGSKGSSFEF